MDRHDTLRGHLPHLVTTKDGAHLHMTMPCHHENDIILHGVHLKLQPDLLHHRVRSTSSSGLTFKPTAAGSRSSPTITSPLPKPASLTPISAASNPPTSDRRGLTTTISTTTAPATTITSVIKTEIPIPEYKSTSRSSTTTASSSPSIITTTAPVTPTTPIVITKTTTKTATATPSSTSSSTTAPTPTPRTTPLTPAEELEEELSKKRFKNTLAARRSRAKKVMILEQERLRVTELESVNKALQIRVAVLEAEQKQWLIVKETMGLRIARLETELAHARELIKERE
ncbi:hypothetical protein FBU30_009548 [Linnemannia zychae]|nr:hypothetical protein FBU30_009548 [Linnemannia zychae]